MNKILLINDMDSVNMLLKHRIESNGFLVDVADTGKAGIEKAEVKAVLIGGFAVNHYNVSRNTVDIDFLCIKEDFDKVFVFLVKEGYKVRNMQKTFVQLEDERKIQMDVDFMFVDRDTFNKIEESEKKIDIAGCSFAIPSLYHLIALKIHAIKYNPKVRLFTDLPDIMMLIKNNNIDVEDTEFKNICLKYGNEELYNQIKTFA